ncbi:MAG TPA: hypothetical protein V6C91_14010 [Coleofasciculaceae cyanobacterium]
MTSKCLLFTLAWHRRQKISLAVAKMAVNRDEMGEVALKKLFGKDKVLAIAAS